MGAEFNFQGSGRPILGLVGAVRPMCAVLDRSMLSVAEISDRLEIQQLLVDYSSAIDQRRFDDLDRVFTPDAYIDYRALGGIDGRYPKIKQWLSQVLGNFPVYAHMLGNFSVRVDGDTASSRVICFNPMVFAGDRQQVLFCGLWYDDDFVRTPMAGGSSGGSKPSASRK